MTPATKWTPTDVLRQLGTPPNARGDEPTGCHERRNGPRASDPPCGDPPGCLKAVGTPTERHRVGQNVQASRFVGETRGDPMSDIPTTKPISNHLSDVGGGAV